MRGLTRNLAVVSTVVLSTSLVAGTAHALEPDGSIAIRLPKGVQLRNVALAATGSIALGDHSTVSGPATGVGSVANVGPGQTQIGAFANVQTDVISAPRVVLGGRARIGGAVVTTTAPLVLLGATVAGGITANADLSPATRFAWQPPAPTTGGDITLTAGNNVTLPPGAYGDVTILPLAQLTLGAGVYQMDSLELEHLTTLTFDTRSGPVLVYVASKLEFEGAVVVLGNARDLGVFFEGTRPTAIETAFSGAIVAPYAPLRLAGLPGREFHGQFVGQSLLVDPGVRVTYAPFDWDAIAPQFGAGNSLADSVLTPRIHGAPLACFAPSFSGTTTQTTSGDTVYTSLAFASPDPANGVCAPQFCDDNNNPVPGPTQAQLNAPPPAGSTCAAVAPSDNCPIDTNALTTLCTSDADCGAGGICASRCVDVACTNIEHRCGKPAATCVGLPAEANCDEFRLCPLPGAVGTPNLQALQQQLPTTSSPGPTGQIPATEQDTPPGEYSRVELLRCETEAAPEVGNLADGADRQAGDGSSQWGVFLEPTTSFSVKPVKRTDGIGELTMSAGGGVVAGARLFGHRIPAFSATVKADLTDCGVTLTGAVKLFDQAVAVWTPSAGQAFHLVTDDKGGSLATPALAGENCKTARENTKNAIKDARKSNLLARAVREYYFQHGLTPDLCDEIERQLGPKAILDPNTGKRACGDGGTLADVPAATQIDILNAWKEEYDGDTARYVDFSNDLGTKRQAIQTSGTIDLFKTPHPYHVGVLDQDIPIGPIDLNLAVEGFGAWDIKGGIQFGIGVSGNFDNATAILGNSLNGQAPRIGDIRAYAGPVITPDFQIGVLAYVGVGIPGVSVGIQGQIDLLDISLPSGVVAAAMRLSEPDPRTLTGTDYEGTPIAGMESNDYRWVTGYNWSSKLQLSELNGELDLAVRIHFLFFKHTFKHKLFSWPGLTQSFTLVKGGTGDTLAFTGDYGKQADKLA